MITKDIILLAVSIVLFISLVVNAHLAEQNSTMKIMIVNLWNLKQEMYELSRKGESMSDLIERQDAIERIKLQMDRPDTFGWWTRNDKIAEACYKIAIEILERLPSAEPQVRTYVSLADCVSRQAAIDEIMELPNCENGYSDTYDKARIVGVLEGLPSAEPEIIRCRDCKWSEIDDPDFPDQYFCNESGNAWNKGDHWCSYAERAKE